MSRDRTVTCIQIVRGCERMLARARRDLKAAALACPNTPLTVVDAHDTVTIALLGAFVACDDALRSALALAERALNEADTGDFDLAAFVRRELEGEEP